MILASSLPTLLFWLVLSISAVGVAVWLVCAILLRAKIRSAPVGTGQDLAEKLRAANALLSETVRAEQRLIAAIAALPADIAPSDALTALDRLMPNGDVHDRFNLLLHVWRNHGQPQALAALAGMTLNDLSGTYGILDIGLRMAIAEGGPDLLDAIAAALHGRLPALDRWLQTGGLLVEIEQAAARLDKTAPDTAERLRHLAAAMAPRTHMLLHKTLDFCIARVAEADPSEFDVKPDILDAARKLAPLCMPRFPDLLPAALAALRRQHGPEWQVAPAELVSAVLYHVGGDATSGALDIDMMRDTLCDGLMAEDAAVSQATANIVAALLSDGFFSAARHAAHLQAALDWAIGTHAAISAYDWMGDELNPPDLSAENLRRLEAGIEQHAAIRDGIKTLEATTSAIEPAVALAELRHLLPRAPVDLLRPALAARWEEVRNPVLLVALIGLAMEVSETVPVDGRLMQLCLHNPLMQGLAPVVASAVELLAGRLASLDNWLVIEASMRDLTEAATRFAGDPDLSGPLEQLRSQAEARRIVLLEEIVMARLAEEARRDDDSLATQLALDLYRHCLPGVSTLAPPVRDFMRACRDRPAWREALLHLETMTVLHFGPQDRLARYDFDLLQRLLCDGIADTDPSVAALAANCATRLVSARRLTRPAHLAGLASALDRATAAVPDGRAALRKALAAHHV